MASILDRYGIKEVCDFTFYTINDATGKPEAPALYLDTLKVSTIEQTADLVEAKGGKGNVTLLSWDTNKEISVTLEDALFSAKSLAIMFGNGKLKSYTGSNAYIMRTETFTASANAALEAPTSAGWKANYEGPTGDLYVKRNPKFYNADGTNATAFVDGTTYFCSYDIKVDGSVVEIGANTFPGTYYCVGDTFAMNAKSGRNEFFQFIIPKAKVQSGNTITLQAEGDPSTFSMNLKVMKPDDGIMMKLVKYDAVEPESAGSEGTEASVDHNHVLKTANTLLASVEVAVNGSEDVAVTGATSSYHVSSSDDTVATGAAGTGKITVSVPSTATAGKFATLTVLTSETGGTVVGVIDVKTKAAAG